MARRSFWDKFWRDKNGEDVIWQRPNIFLITWFVCTVINLVLSYSFLKQALGLIGLVALFVWSLWEVTTGVNYFRRLLGLIVLVLLLAGRLL